MIIFRNVVRILTIFKRSFSFHLFNIKKVSSIGEMLRSQSHFPGEGAGRDIRKGNDLSCNFIPVSFLDFFELSGKLLKEIFRCFICAFRSFISAAIHSFQFFRPFQPSCCSSVAARTDGIQIGSKIFISHFASSLHPYSKPRKMIRFYTDQVPSVTHLNAGRHPSAADEDIKAFPTVQAAIVMLQGKTDIITPTFLIVNQGSMSFSIHNILLLCWCFIVTVVSFAAYL